MDNWYYDEAEVARRVALGDHRALIGGMWDEIGELQFRWLVAQGMAPHHKLLDLGCGCGRLAVKAVPYLDAHNYFGIDISPSLLAAARSEIEAAGVLQKLSQDALRATAHFDPSPAMPAVDFIMALSLFTHLTLQRLPTALRTIRAHMAPGARFYATFFTAPEGTAQMLHPIGGVTTYAEHDPYHFAPDHILSCVRSVGWKARFIGDWNHPRDQQMFEFTE